MRNPDNRDPARLDRARTLLVLVDVQEKLFPFIDGRDELAAEIDKLIKFADVLGIPVLHMEQGKLGPTIPGLRALMGERVPAVKETFGGFGCREFASRVEEFAVDTLVLIGMETHVCVLQTAMEALMLGYRVQVVADAVGSRSPLHKEVALRRMRAAGVEVTVGESFMFEMMVKANTDEFRKVLPLIK